MAQLSPSRAALVSLVLFATMIAFAQPLSVVAADHLLLNEPVGATYAMWHQYVSSPKDVDFIGDSRVAIDTDTSQVAGELQMATGVQESVGALGVGGTDVVTERAVVYRVVHLQRRPRMVVLSFSEFQYSNPNNVDPTANLWQMTEPYDLGFMRFAYTVDPNRGRLLRGWGLPVIPNSLFTAVIMRQHLNTIGAMRWILGDTSAPPTTPAGDQAVPSAPAMSAQTEAAVLDFYRTSYGLGQFRFASDRLEQMRQAVRLARDAGIEVRFVIYPVYLIDSINPDGYANYLTRIRALSYELNVPLTDLHDADRDPAHYSDPSHLNAVGARQLAPRLAQVIAS